MSAILSNQKELEEVKHYLESGRFAIDFSNKIVHPTVTLQSVFYPRSRCAATMKAIKEGLREKSIIEIAERKDPIHPTQKPVRLLERLMALVTKEGDIVLDPFSGSASTAVACINKQRQYIGFEIDKEYYDLSMKRLFDIQKNGIEQSLFSEAAFDFEEED